MERDRRYEREGRDGKSEEGQEKRLRNICNMYGDEKPQSLVDLKEVICYLSYKSTGLLRIHSRGAPNLDFPLLYSLLLLYSIYAIGRNRKALDRVHTLASGKKKFYGHVQSHFTYSVDMKCTEIILHPNLNIIIWILQSLIIFTIYNIQMYRID